MNQEDKRRKKRLGALDICILAAVFLCMVGVGARFVFRQESTLTQSAMMDEYLVNFAIYDIRCTSEDYLKEGKVFYLHDSGDRFGVLEGDASVENGKKLYTLDNGHVIERENTFTAEHLRRIDVTGTFRISATVDADGFIYLNGNTQIAPNKELEVRSRDIFTNIRITSIVKAN